MATAPVQAPSQYNTSGYPAPFLAPFGELLADYTASELNRPVDISGIMPQSCSCRILLLKQHREEWHNKRDLGAIQYDPQGRIIGFGQGTGIAAYEPFLQQAAAQVQAGPSGYQQYMSPYQQDVINEAVKRQEEYGAQQQQNLAASAVGQGAFGGGRYDVARGQLQRGTTEAIGKTVADLQAQNYAQAIGRQQQGIANLLALPGSSSKDLNQSLQSRFRYLWSRVSSIQSKYFKCITTRRTNSYEFSFPKTSTSYKHIWWTFKRVHQALQECLYTTSPLSCRC
jgi:hypothetical protein